MINLVAALFLSQFAMATSAQDVKNKAGETVNTAVEYTKEQKQAFIQEMEDNISSLKKQIAELKGKQSKQMDDLKTKQANLEQDLSKLKKSSGNAWGQLRAGMSKAWTEIKTSYQSAKEEFKK
jgi:TolA-binding protein